MNESSNDIRFTFKDHLRLFDPGCGELEMLEITFIFDDDIPNSSSNRTWAMSTLKCAIDSYTHIVLRDIDHMGYSFTRCLTCGSLIVRGAGGAVLLRATRWSSRKHVSGHKMCVACSRNPPRATERAMNIVDGVLNIEEYERAQWLNARVSQRLANTTATAT